MLANNSLNWNDIWPLLIAGAFALFLSILIYSTQKDPEESAQKYTWRGKYIFGDSKSWALRNKYLPLILIIFSIICFLVSIIIAIILVL